MKITVLLLALLTSACATRHLTQGLQGLVGQNIQAAVARLGYPNGQREIMGDTIYVWSINRNVVLPMTNTTTSSGVVGGTPYYGTTSSPGFMPMQLACTVQIATTPDGTIKSFQWEGNEAGCRRYASGFR